MNKIPKRVLYLRLAKRFPETKIERYIGYVAEETLLKEDESEDDIPAYFFDVFLHRTTMISPVQVIEFSIYDRLFKKDIATDPKLQLEELFNMISNDNLLPKIPLLYKNRAGTISGENIELGKKLEESFLAWLGK